MSSMPRHGMPSRPFTSVEDYIDRVCDLPFLMRPTKHGFVRSVRVWCSSVKRENVKSITLSHTVP